MLLISRINVFSVNQCIAPYQGVEHIMHDIESQVEFCCQPQNINGAGDIGQYVSFTDCVKRCFDPVDVVYVVENDLGSQVINGAGGARQWLHS